MAETQHFEYFSKAQTSEVGFDAYRAVTNTAVYEDAYRYLRGNYGIDVLPCEDAPGMLVLATAQEMGSALIRTGIAELGATAIESVMEKVTGSFNYDMQHPMLSATNKFSVSTNAIRGGNRLIALRMTNDERHAQHRHIITSAFNATTGVALAWPPSRALLPVALLADPSLADKIRKTGKRAPIRVPLSQVILGHISEHEAHASL